MKNFFTAVLTAASFNTGAVSLTPEQQLGEVLYKDKNLSLNRNQSCESCHALKPSISATQSVNWLVPGFVDTVNVVNGTAVPVGSVQGESGTLNSPSVAYAAFSPKFRYDTPKGEYIGGAILEWSRGRFNTTSSGTISQSCRNGDD